MHVELSQQAARLETRFGRHEGAEQARVREEGFSRSVQILEDHEECRQCGVSKELPIHPNPEPSIKMLHDLKRVSVDETEQAVAEGDTKQILLHAYRALEFRYAAAIIEDTRKS